MPLARHLQRGFDSTCVNNTPKQPGQATLQRPHIYLNSLGQSAQLRVYFVLRRIMKTRRHNEGT
jgi:hypothetical protein